MLKLGIGLISSGPPFNSVLHGMKKSTDRMTLLRLDPDQQLPFRGLERIFAAAPGFSAFQHDRWQPSGYMWKPRVRRGESRARGWSLRYPPIRRCCRREWTARS